MKSILGNTHETHTPTVASAAVGRAEVAAFEVHAVREGATVVRRSRPVVALGTDIADRSLVPVARSGQEETPLN